MCIYMYVCEGGGYAAILGGVTLNYTVSKEGRIREK
jgi:hypothetical protein